MAVLPLVPETKMADVRKLISLGDVLVKKVTWLVFTTTSIALILSRAFGADCRTRIIYIHTLVFQELIPFYVFTSRDSTLSLYPLRLTETGHCLSFSNILISSSRPHENVYIFVGLTAGNPIHSITLH